MFTADLEILGMSINRELLEITYVNPDTTTREVMDVITKRINPAMFEDELNEILESARELLDAALIYQRNPPATR